MTTAVDPSNPLGFDENGQMIRTLPDDQSSGSVVAALLPASAHYVKAFGTLASDGLSSSANSGPRRAVLLYATDDDAAAAAIERLIRAAGFEPLKVGGLVDAGRIDMPGGDLHQFGLNGELLDLDQARPLQQPGCAHERKRRRLPGGGPLISTHPVRDLLPDHLRLLQA